MKIAIDWFKEKGFTFYDKITIVDVIELQQDARKDGLMSGLSIASETIHKNQEDYCPADYKLPRSQYLSGLQYKVSSAILSEADKLNYLPKTELPSV